MAIDERILKELNRYNSINKYIMEQAEPPIPEDPAALPADPAALPADPAAAPPADPAVAGAVPPPPAPPADESQPIDPATDPDVEEIGGEGNDEDVEELDITELVDSQTSMADKQEEYFNNLFDQLNKMQERLGEMDQIVNKIDMLDAKIDKIRPKTAQEKLELRSLDSGPFKQKLSDFFQDKMVDMEKTGKEYVLTADEVENYSPSAIESSFDEYLPKATDFTK